MPSDLTQSQLDDFERDHASWTRSGDAISRTFVFGDFNESMGFVTRIAIASEVADHHPDIEVRWNKVTIVLSTHSESALTSKDLALARQFDTY